LLPSRGFAHPPAGQEEDLREAQDREFRETELEDTRLAERHSSTPPRDHAEVEANAEGERDRTQSEFAELAVLAPTDPEVVLCRFKFRDRTEKVPLFERAERPQSWILSRGGSPGRKSFCSGRGSGWRTCPMERLQSQDRSRERMRLSPSKRFEGGGSLVRRTERSSAHSK
jgi:hypothetical protein